MCKSSQIPESEIPIGAKIKFIHLAFENRFNQNLQELNLTSSQMHLLVYLDRCENAGKKINQRMIEKHLHLSNPTVTGLLQRLEAKGFVSRKVSDTDGRNKEIQQTDACKALHNEMHRRLDAENDRMVTGLSEAEIAELNRLLMVVLKNMQE